MAQKKSAHTNIYIYLLLFLAIFIVLSSRLFYLQILNGEKYQTQSASNSLKLINLPTKRGDILDANGEILATSVPIASINFDTNAITADKETTIHNLAILLAPLEVNEAKILETIDAANKKGIYGTIEIIKIPYDQSQGLEIIGKFYERAKYLPAATVNIIPTRYYPLGPTLGNIIGYVGAISQEEYTDNEDIYTLTDTVGKLGIERSMEIFKKEGYTIKGLMGTKGTQAVEVDSQGRTVNVKSSENASIPGDNVTLTIDIRLQEALEKELNNQINISKAANSKAGAGAAIVFNVNTGEILAMSSKPDLDPNDFLDGLSDEEVKYYLENDQSPMLNKVINVAYPPGSTFKMITALSGLHYSGLTVDYKETCTGIWRDNIKCTGVHGTINLTTALTVSCNVYFQSFAEQTGIENISKTASQFGLGVDTGFTDLKGVTKGFLPTEASKAIYEKNYRDGMISKVTEETSKSIVEINQDNSLTSSSKKEQIEVLEQEKDITIAKYERYYQENKDWYIHDTDLVSIGQGLNNYSVLQLGEYISTLANGGTRYKPTLIKSIASSDGKSVYTVTPLILNKVEMTEEEIEPVKIGMQQVTTIGTARRIFIGSGLSVAGKTGTAETGRSSDIKEYHGVFVGYSPVAKPEIAVAVVVEYAKNSSSTAAAVAKAVLQKYFSLKGK
ncbi:MAG: penicillin-binding transpeptidase domain-containing protein [Firmicutes bacterium]|nr:penicillin-binding transpeptidase domain-containing protein [Bacillota bacterium]